MTRRQRTVVHHPPRCGMGAILYGSHANCRVFLQQRIHVEEQMRRRAESRRAVENADEDEDDDDIIDFPFNRDPRPEVA